jgi:hypothetical protein
LRLLRQSLTRNAKVPKASKALAAKVAARAAKAAAKATKASKARDKKPELTHQQVMRLRVTCLLTT